MATWKSDRKLWLNADRTQVLEDGDPNAAFLLVGAGGEIPDVVAQKYNLGSPAPQEGAYEREMKAFQDALARGAFVEASSRANTLQTMDAVSATASGPAAGSDPLTPFKNGGSESFIGKSPDPLLDTQEIATANAAAPAVNTLNQLQQEIASAKANSANGPSTAAPDSEAPATEDKAAGNEEPKEDTEVKAETKDVKQAENKLDPSISSGPATPSKADNKPAAGGKAETK